MGELEPDPIDTMAKFAADYESGAFHTQKQYGEALHRLCEVISLVACVHPDGKLAVHLMNLSFSFDFSQTLTSIIAEDIDEPEEERLTQWSNTLRDNLRIVERALKQCQTS